MQTVHPVEHDYPVNLDVVLISDELAERPAGRPDPIAENAALRALVRGLALDPDSMPQTLVETALQCCDAGTTGLSLIESTLDGGEQFRWVALAGALASYVGGTTPRDHSPCGVTLSRNAPQLFDRPGRYFEYFADLDPAIEEGLVIPLPGPEPLGTIWAVKHDPDARFTQNDVRLLEVLAEFAAASLRLSIAAAEQSRLHYEASEAVRARDTFLATVSHDLKSPLAAMRAHVQLLKRRVSRGKADVDALVSGLDSIEQGTGRMAGMIDELLEAAKFQHGYAPAESMQPTDLVALVRMCAIEQTSQTQRPIKIDTDAEELWLSVDERRMAHVFGNLMSNAIRYSPEDSDIEVAISLETDEGGQAWAVFDVSDRGIGIADEDLPYIFDWFRRGGNVSGTGGTGIGLAAAREIVMAHGGTIHAISQPGAGTTLTVRLPSDQQQTWR